MYSGSRPAAGPDSGRWSTHVYPIQHRCKHPWVSGFGCPGRADVGTIPSASAMIEFSRMIPVPVKDSHIQTSADIVLAALAAGGEHIRYNPAQVQNLLFLADRESGLALDGSRFAFEPSPSGPYSEGVWEVLADLAAEDLVLVDRTGWYWTYTVSELGKARGKAVLARMARPVAKRLSEIADWVLALAVWELVLEIARRYPETNTDGRIQRWARRRPRRAAPQRLHPFLVGIAKVIGNGDWRSEPVSAAQAAERDAAAISSDWWTVGDDLRFAMERVGRTR